MNSRFDEDKGDARATDQAKDQAEKVAQKSNLGQQAAQDGADQDYGTNQDQGQSGGYDIEQEGGYDPNQRGGDQQER
jgi:hypothetical protein